MTKILILDRNKLLGDQAKMKPLLTYRDYKALEDMWKQSTTGSQLLFSLPQDCLPGVRNGLRKYNEWVLKETDDEEFNQFKEDCETAETDCKLRIQDGKITQKEAEREVADAMWWKAITETQFQEHMDVILASKLREFVSIRELLLC